MFHGVGTGWVVDGSDPRLGPLRGGVERCAAILEEKSCPFVGFNWFVGLLVSLVSLVTWFQLVRRFIGDQLVSLVLLGSNWFVSSFDSS